MGRVLVIDDEPQIRALLRRGLEPEGHEVVEAGDGVVGLRIYQEQRCDLVITDILMPDQEGIGCIMELHRLDPHVRIIAISGASGALPMDVLGVARHLGARRTFSKPFDVMQVVAAVREELEDRRAA
jgi:DNA-binding NtrC family response regulator